LVGEGAFDVQISSYLGDIADRVQRALVAGFHDVIAIFAGIKCPLYVRPRRPLQRVRAALCGHARFPFTFGSTLEHGSVRYSRYAPAILRGLVGHRLTACLVALFFQRSGLVGEGGAVQPLDFGEYEGARLD
jgi:hypothetical protein